MRRVAQLLLALLLAAAPLSVPAVALAPEEVMEDPALDARARALYERLRCVVCSNQSVGDSDARMAADMRALVRERLLAGETDGQIIDFLVGAYGDYILLTPRFTWTTSIVWITPVAALGVGLFWAWRRTRRGASNAAPTTQGPQGLSEEERRRLDEIMGRD